MINTDVEHSSTQSQAEYSSRSLMCQFPEKCKGEMWHLDLVQNIYSTDLNLGEHCVLC